MNDRKDKKYKRLGERRYNYQGCLMEITEYNNSLDIAVEFKDIYKAKIHSYYHHFLSGNIKNPYYPSVSGVGMIGIKYPSREKGKHTKEYQTWRHMLERCFDEKTKEKRPYYKDVTCCKEWLLYENFYEWLHSQENFDKWLNGERWALDKDILIKRNKVYSPETCCLVPYNVNCLFTKRNSCRGTLPIGVIEHNGKFIAECNNPFKPYKNYLGIYSTQEEAFFVYKECKEIIIKQVAQIEFDNGNITEKCYNAMMNYQVEITD